MLDKEDKLTAPGLSDGPVPAAVPAGGQSSISSYCTGVVMNQATTSSDVTGRLEAATSHENRNKEPGNGEPDGATKDLLKPEFRQRMGSTASGRTYSYSDLSHTSGLTDDSTEDRRTFRLEYESLLEKNKMMFHVIESLQAEVQKMQEVCKKAPNTSNGIKNGLKVVEQMAKEVYEQAKTVHYGFDMYKCDVESYQIQHKKREKIRKTKQRAAVVLAVEQAVQEKRTRSPESSPDKRKRKRGKKEAVPTIIITDDNNEAGSHKTKRDRILVKVLRDQTFASVLKKMKSDFKPELSNATVQGIASTSKGDILLKVKGNIDRANIEAHLNKVVAGIGEVQSGQKRIVTLEIRDLDALTEKEDVERAIAEALGKTSGRREVTMLRPNIRQQMTALVRLGELEAKKLEKLVHLRVGFVSCRIRRRIDVERCFRCLEFGHIATRCGREDRSNLCFRCGSSNHRKKDCRESPCCFLCKGKEQQKHEAGSGACSSFRNALQDARLKQSRKQ